jgi:5'-3' exonuclease
MKTYILLDLANIFSRARFAVRGDLDAKVGMAMHITLNSIKKAWTDFSGDHLIVCLEGRSWRKDFYAPYKRNRAQKKAGLNQAELEEEHVFWEVFEELKNFFNEKTNCTVLHHPRLEADDLIAGWVQHHPDDKHVIISADSDFAQLVSNNVIQYNGMADTTTRITGYYDGKGKPIIDKKTSKPKDAPDPEWLLFEKCIRGDVSDNVFSAYPGVRTKGSKNKVGLIEAFQDRKNKGFVWNNLMLQRWTDHEGVEHRVLDDYNRNKTLCDLTAQPEEIKNIIAEVVGNVSEKAVSQVGIKFMKFCAKWDLRRISDQAVSFSKPLSAGYEK